MNIFPTYMPTDVYLTEPIPGGKLSGDVKSKSVLEELCVAFATAIRWRMGMCQRFRVRTSIASTSFTNIILLDRVAAVRLFLALLTSILVVRNAKGHFHMLVPIEISWSDLPPLKDESQVSP